MLASNFISQRDLVKMVIEIIMCSDNADVRTFMHYDS